MKVIKLDGRHNLKSKGYSWAFRFKGWSPEAGKVESAVKKLEGYHWDCTFWGKTNKYGSRPYYVGVKKESTLTMVLLKAGG
jgi:hypothetical protein